MKIDGASILIIGIFLVFLGIGFMPGSYENLKGSISSESWPKTNGLIKKSTRESRVVATGLAIGLPYKVGLIVYEYNVKRVKFISTRISYRGGNPTKETLDKYPEGLSVQVYYNPHNPKEAVLEPGLKSTAYFELGGVILFFLVGGYLMIFGLKQFKNIGDNG